MQQNKRLIKSWIKKQNKIGQKVILPIVILSFFSNIISMGIAWCIAQILGKLLLPSIHLPVSTSVLLSLYIVLILLKGVLIYSEELTAIKIGLIARKRLRSEVLTQIIAAGPILLYKHSIGALSSIVIDQIESLDGYFSRWLPISILWILSPCTILIFVFFIQPWAALIIGLCGLMVPVAQALFGIGAAVAARKQFIAMMRLQGRFMDRIKGIATIVLLGRSNDEAKKLAFAANELRICTMKVLRVAFLSSASIDCAMIVSIILVAMVDVGSFYNSAPFHSVPVTHALFALLIIPEFFQPLRNFALAYQDRAKLNSAAASIVVLPESSNKDKVNKSWNETELYALEFSDVSFFWDPARGKALENISFKTKSNENITLIGPSGAGKSTLIDLLLGFIKPTSGIIKLNGVDITTLNSENYASLLAWIGQRPVIFSSTIKENILFANPNASEEQFNKAIELASMKKIIQELPRGIDTVVGEGGYGLSGGQAQRIAVARAFLKDAPLILLDEPTAHLDPRNEADIFESIRILAQNKLVVLATHSVSGHHLEGLHLTLEKGHIMSRMMVN